MPSCVKRRRLRSNCWEFFTTSADRTEAKCKICDAIFRTPNGATSPLQKHLHAKHLLEMETDNDDTNCKLANNDFNFSISISNI